MPDLLDRLAAGWRGWVVAAALTILAALPGLFSIPPLDRDESRFAQATTQMLETGDFIRIRLQLEPRNKKPVGAYWLQAASVALLSSPEARQIWAYRIPSVLGALAAALGTFWIGTLLFDRRAALLGAALLGTSVLLSTEALIAKTDAILCGAVVWMMAGLAQLRVGRGGALLFWGMLALGALVKGPIAPMAGALTLAALWLWERRIAWVRPLLDWRGIALAVAILVPWFVAIMLATNGAFLAELLGRDVASKLTAGAEHRFTPPGAHTLLIPLLLFPATLALPGAVVALWQAMRGKRDDAELAPARFLAAWALPLWLVFELAPVKLAHYLLPIYPALALLCGEALAHKPKSWAGAALFALAAAALATVACALSFFAPGDAATGARRVAQNAMVIGVALLPFLAAIALLRAPGPRAAAAIGASLLLLTLARERIAPEARQLFPSHEAALALAREDMLPRLNPEASGPVILVGHGEPSLVFETGTDAVVANPEIAALRAQAGSPLVVEARAFPALARALAVKGLAFSPVGPPISGLDYSNGHHPVTLQIGRAQQLIQPSASPSPH